MSDQQQPDDRCERCGVRDEYNFRGVRCWQVPCPPSGEIIVRCLCVACRDILRGYAAEPRTWEADLVSDTKTPDDREQTDWRCARCGIDVQIVAPFGSIYLPPECPYCRGAMERTSG